MLNHISPQFFSNKIEVFRPVFLPNLICFLSSLLNFEVGIYYSPFIPVFEEAKELGLKISKVSENALKEAIRRQKRRESSNSPFSNVG